VRNRAAEALGGLGDKRAFEPLTRLLRHEDKWVRVIAAEALGGWATTALSRPSLGFWVTKFITFGQPLRRHWGNWEMRVRSRGLLCCCRIKTQPFGPKQSRPFGSLSQNTQRSDSRSLAVFGSYIPVDSR